MKSETFSIIGQAVMEAIYPPTCYVCGDFLDTSRTPLSSIFDEPNSPSLADFMSGHMCPACAGEYVAVGSPLCTTCGVMFKSPHAGDHICGECRRVPKYFHSARAAGIYEKSLMTALQQLKYQGRVELAKSLGRLLSAAFLKWYDPDNFDLITPIPLHPRKMRQRSFNQAWLLIRNWCRPEEKGGLFFSQSKMQKDLLKRTRLTRSQTKLSKSERMENVRGAFALTDADRVRGQSVLLVDDVYTTGATVNECAKVLSSGGAARVDVLTVARVR